MTTQETPIEDCCEKCEEEEYIDFSLKEGGVNSEIIYTCSNKKCSCHTTTPRAEKCPGKDCVYSSVGVCPFDGSMHTPTPRGWDEHFEENRPKSDSRLDSGDESDVYKFGYKLKSGGWIWEITDWGNIKSFIQSTIDSAVEAERRRITKGVMKSKWGEFINLEQVLSIINPKK